jgi:DNA-directed RNA polymerase I, II, and III subunit RPABC2
MAEEESYDIAEEEVFDEEFLQEDESATQAINVRPELRKLYQQHPECLLEYVETVIPKIPLIVSPPSSTKVDINHRTYPFLTIYEKTKIIGLRANQLSQGSRPFITVPEHVSDVREIARLELDQKRLPFIVKRPLPNGKYEYWRLSDLMIL